MPGIQSSHSAPIVDSPIPSGEPTQRPLHRITEVCELQGVNLRTAARRMNTTLSEARAQQQPTYDMRLSTLYRWQQALEVPAAELLTDVDIDESLSPSVKLRANLLRMMKTVLAIQEKATQPAVQRMIQSLAHQFIELMPELRDVTPWHSVGTRRTLDEFGRIVDRMIPDPFVELAERHDFVPTNHQVPRS